MNKKIILVGIIAALVVIAAASSIGPQSNVPQMYDGRYHGDISTAFASPVMGNSNASVTIVEFGDYQCHQCYNWFHNTKPSLVNDYIETGKVNLVFVDLAFLGNDSPGAAQASYCAEDQGKYWEYHDVLYNNQGPQIDSGWASSENLKRFASEIGLDTAAFDNCLDSGEHKDRVEYNIKQAKSHNVHATPGFFIFGPDGQQQKISGAQPLSVFQSILDRMI